MTMNSCFRTGSRPSTMPMTFCVEPAILATAVWIAIFFSALSAKESSFVPAAAPSNTCAPLSRSPWKSALVSATPAVMVGTEAGRPAWKATTWNAGPFGPAARPVAGAAMALSCWKVGIMTMPSAPCFAA